MESDLVPFRRLVLSAVALMLVALGLLPGPATAAPPPGTGQLTVPGSVSFPTTTIGAATGQQMTLKNESEAVVDVSEVKIEGTDSGDYAIEGENCTGFIGPSSGCVLNLRFSPTAGGPREASLRIVTDGTPAEYITELSGEGAAPQLVFEPGGHDFGLVEAHSGDQRTQFTVRNVGGAQVQVSNLGITGPDANEFNIDGNNCVGSNLAPGATCGIEVQFNANGEGDFHAAVSISANAATFQAPLSGRAERPRVEATPSPLAFGSTAVGSAQVKELTLTNTGNLPVGFYIALVSGGDIGSFHLLAENCTSNVFSGKPRIFEPGESCTAKVAFEPSSVGAKAATISFFGGGEGALQVPVEGTAVAASVDSSASSRDSAAAPAAASSSTPPAPTTEPGRVTLDAKQRLRPVGGKVTIGRAHCDSTQPCVVRIGGLVPGPIPTAAGRRPAVRGLPSTIVKLAPGASTPITITLPREFRDATSGTLWASMHWQTSTDRGADVEIFRLGPT